MIVTLSLFASLCNLPFDTNHVVCFMDGLAMGRRHPLVGRRGKGESEARKEEAGRIAPVW